MAAKRTQNWGVGDLFTIQLIDGTYGIGQVADILVPNTASCAFFNRRLSTPSPTSFLKLKPTEAIAGVAVVDAHLDRGAWKVFSNCPVILQRMEWPSETARGNSLVGLKVYTGAILEDFLNAFYAMLPWDKFHDPHYLDKILLNPSKKPSRLMLKSSAWRQ